MVEAAENLLAGLTTLEREEVEGFKLDSDDFRMWSNPELYINPGGLRLDETTAASQELVHALLKASLSNAGYEKILGCCLTNEFLGQLVNSNSFIIFKSVNLNTNLLA